MNMTLIEAERKKHIDMFSTILDMFLLAMTLAGQISIDVNKYHSFFLEQQFPLIQMVSLSFLAVQDSSIGDIVTQSLIKTDF